MIAALKGGGVSTGVPRHSRCPFRRHVGRVRVEAPSPEQPVLRSKSVVYIPALYISPRLCACFPSLPLLSRVIFHLALALTHFGFDFSTFLCNCNISS